MKSADSASSPLVSASPGGGDATIGAARRRIFTLDSLWLTIIFLVALGLRVWLIAQPLPDLFSSNILIDDAYYAFSYAREFAEGRPYQVGPGQVGNGFQPLYLAVISPLFRFARFDPELPIRLSLLFLSVCSAATAVVLVIWARHLGAGRAAIVAGVLWAFSPAVILQSLNGVETAMNLLILSILGAWWRHFVRRPLVLGLMLGVCILSRVDNVLLLPVIGFLIWNGGRRSPAGEETDKASSSPRLDLRYAVLCGAGILVVLSPYLISSYYYTGRLTPISGPAVRNISQYHQWDDANLFFSWSLIWENAKHAVYVLRTEAFHHLLPRLQETEGWSPIFVWSLFFGSAFVIALSSARSLASGLKKLHWRGWKKLAPGLVLLIVWVAVYVLYMGGRWFYIRYFHGALLLLTLLSAMALGRFVNFGSRINRPAAAAFLSCYIVLSAYSLRDTLEHNYFPSHEWIPYVEAKIEDGGRVGMFQSGLFGYHLGGQVVNLGGVVNVEAVEALRNKEIDRYLREENITFVMDWDWVMRSLFFNRSRPGHYAARQVEMWSFYDAYALRWLPPPETLAAKRNSIPGGRVILPGDPELAPEEGWGVIEMTDAEDVFCWTLGDHQRMDFAAPEIPGLYELKLLFYRPHPFPRDPLSVEYRLPGDSGWSSTETRVGSVSITGKIEVVEPHQMLHLELKVPSWSPADWTENSGDHRRIGMMFLQMEIRPINAEES